ncbi:MAG: XTP/dITP diphosphatase [Bacteroidetes bacterium]|nr:MAG: XTP/dITP diphosphatase [Bacteroidota bacterium]
MPQLLLATRNKGKLVEMQALLASLPYQILSVSDFPELPEVEEDKETMEENALKKARTIFSLTNISTIADDSGLEVYSLGMKPGVYSARYAGENVSYADNNRKLLKELEGIPLEKRKARFRCVSAFVSDKEEKLFEGTCEGTIIDKPRGTNGFGYDPLFQPIGYSQTLAELPLEVKNRISHRGKAFRSLKEYLGILGAVSQVLL